MISAGCYGQTDRELTPSQKRRREREEGGGGGDDIKNEVVNLDPPIPTPH